MTLFTIKEIDGAEFRRTIIVLIQKPRNGLSLRSNK
jgi:hypothetical protein